MYLLFGSIVVAHIVPGQGAVFGGDGLEPADYRLVVVGTGVDHGIDGIVVGQIVIGRAGVTGVEGKFQNLHAGETGIPDQLTDRICHIAQVFRNHFMPAQIPFHAAEQIDAGTLLPVAVFRGGIAVGNGVVLIKTPEVVDAGHIVHLVYIPQTAQPPLVSGLLVIVPAVQRIAPELAGSREAIRRTSRYSGRNVIFIQLEQFGMGPSIGRVHGNINRNIADDLNVFFVGISL